MENSGVGMRLGDTSVTALWMMFIGAFILGGTILYRRYEDGEGCAAASVRSSTENTEMAQRRDDPEKRAAR